MKYTIHFDPVVPRQAVSIHAWEESSGQVWDFAGEPAGGGSFDFVLDIGSHDLRQIQFKFRFPLENDLWESDDFVRRLPDVPNLEIWCFGFSARCSGWAPGAPATLPSLRVWARSRQEYRSGALLVWSPTRQDAPLVVPESARDDAAELSRFDIPWSDWMSAGFHFKLRDARGADEPDRAIKVWRPADGGEVWIKGRQFVVRRAPFELLIQRVDLVRPASHGPQKLLVDDPAGDDSRLYDPQATAKLDDAFVKESYQVSLFEECLYSVRARDEDDGCRRVLTVTPEDPQYFLAVKGDRRWFPQELARSVSVTVVLHPNPQSAFSGDLTFQARIGASAPYETLPAPKSDGSWQALLKVFPGVAVSVDIVSPQGVQESRPDGTFSRLRTFSALSDCTLHTADGISGFCSTGGPGFRDLEPQARRDLMGKAFSPEIAAAGIFAPHELPHGAIVAGNTTWFCLKAPHAVRARLLVLEGSSAGGARQVREVEMSLTPDLRYWWAPAEGAGHGTHYRFLLNDDQEVIDPAARLTNGTGVLWARPGEGAEGPWSIVVDRARIDAAFEGSAWRTMGWEALLIYELHPLRLTQRNAELNAFQRIQKELEPQGYLDRLGVTTLEFLPVNEYPKMGGWGYDPCAYFAIESSYGGPEEFARLVRKAHDSGRGVLLDVVYNHMGPESPLLAVGADLYGDGQTEWGNMVDFDGPAAIEFFRQAIVHLWQAYRLDGFRFDSTRTILESNHPVAGCVRVPGSGGGWEFLGSLFVALHQAASAAGSPWPYLAAENDPINDALTHAGQPHVMDGQWHFGHHYDLSSAAFLSEDKSGGICGNMNYPHNQLRPFSEAVRYAESHDSVSEQDSWKRRIVARTPYDQGYPMAKAAGAAGILAKGIPMLFMGQEAGEHLPFLFGMDKLDDPSRYQRLDDYLNIQDNRTILAWFNSLMAFRNNPFNGFRGDDDQRVGCGPRTVAFSRGWGRFFVIVTFGTPENRQNLGRLGLPGGTYKEVLNSSWPVFNVKGEPEHANGGYDARLSAASDVNLPGIGAVLLERV